MRAANVPLALGLLLVVVLGLGLVERGRGQYMEGTDTFEDVLMARQDLLSEELLEGSFVEDVLMEELDAVSSDPRTYMKKPAPFVHKVPRQQDYVAGLIVDPCKGLDYDCCDQHYGNPEYVVYAEPDETVFRTKPRYLMASSEDSLDGMQLMWEDQSKVQTENSRLADDEAVIDESCVGSNDPTSGCAGFRERQVRSLQSPSCIDNNATVSGVESCQDLDGMLHPHCMAIGYSQTALNFVCGLGADGAGGGALDPQCGTYLEIHMALSNSYIGMDEILADVPILESNVTGFSTTILNTTWQLDDSRVICSYDHVEKLPGTMVLVAEDAPVCCMPKFFSQVTQLGSFMCPILVNGQGPFAAVPKTVTEEEDFEERLKTPPYCPLLQEGMDALMLSQYDAEWGRQYTRQAYTLELNDDGLYSSSDLDGDYADGPCPYFPAAALKLSGECTGTDEEWSFAGNVGKIVSVPDESVSQYFVTFNDGRSAYGFNDEHIIVEDWHNYEVWWVKRARGRSIVEKRKPFTVAEPRCTFDAFHNRYFPYALLDEDGLPID